MRMITQVRGMLWASVVLTVAYALVMALIFYPTDTSSGAEGLLFAEALFAGPMVIAVILSILMARVEARRVIAGFQAGYILITLATFYSTFTGEHDAQYQLALLFIPLAGFMGVVAAGLIAVCFRRCPHSTHSGR